MDTTGRYAKGGDTERYAPSRAISTNAIPSELTLKRRAPPRLPSDVDEEQHNKNDKDIIIQNDNDNASVRSAIVDDQGQLAKRRKKDLASAAEISASPSIKASEGGDMGYLGDNILNDINIKERRTSFDRSSMSASPPLPLDPNIDADDTSSSSSGYSSSDCSCSYSSCSCAKKTENNRSKSKMKNIKNKNEKKNSNSNSNSNATADSKNTNHDSNNGNDSDSGYESSGGYSSSSSYGSDGSSSLDEAAALQRELDRIRSERAEDELRKEKDEIARREAEAMAGNPLLARDGSSNKPAKRRWDEDVVFRGQARGITDEDGDFGTSKGKGKRFINDTIRSDFHRRFLKKYMK